jgi:hypothetical protein
MNSPAAEKSSPSPAPKTEAAFLEIAQAFADDPEVTLSTIGRRFGERLTLKASGRIFAMISSAGKFVVKLPTIRVIALIDAGVAEAFDAGRGRPMKEWAAVEAEPTRWRQLAVEARIFVGSPGSGDTAGGQVDDPRSRPRRAVASSR